MNLDKVSQRLKTLLGNPEDHEELGRLARDLGHSLPAAPLQVLREFRAMVASLREEWPEQDPGTAFARGVLFGLCEIAAAYDSEIRQVREKDELKTFVHQEVNSALLRALVAGASLPGKLARTLGKSDAQVSRALRELRAVGLVEVFSPEDTLLDQRSRPHRLTAEGRSWTQAMGWTTLEEMNEVKPADCKTAEKTLKKKEPVAVGV